MPPPSDSPQKNIFVNQHTDTETHTHTHHKYAEITAFELRCWRRLLRVPWKARRSNQSILKEINPEYSLEGLMLRLKLQNLAT